VYVEDADALYKRATSAGAKPAPGPMGQLADQFWGDRCGSVIDPEGYTWTIATRKEDLTPDEMKRRQDEWMEQFATQAAHS
jgi:PhnB protein